MWGIEELTRIYKAYERDYENDDLMNEELQMDYNYMIMGCIKYHEITPKQHLRVLEDIGGQSPMSIFCDEYLELRDEIESKGE